MTSIVVKGIDDILPLECTEDECLRRAEAWFNGFMTSRNNSLSSYLLVFEVPSPLKESVLINTIGKHYRWVFRMPIQPSMVLFSSFCSGPGILVFHNEAASEAVSSYYVPYVWGPNEEARVSLAVGFISTPELTLAVVQTHKRSGSMHDYQSGRIIRDSETAAIILQETDCYPNTIVVANTPGIWGKHPSFNGNLKRLSALLHMDCVGLHSDYNVFYPSSKVQITCGTEGFSISTKPPGNTTVSPPAAYPFHKDIDVIDSRVSIIYCLLALYLLAMGICSIFTRWFSKRQLSISVKRFSIQGILRLIGTWTSSMFIRKLMLQCSSLLIELAFLQKIKNVYSMQDFRLQPGRRLKAEGIFNFYHDEIQHWTYPAFILFHIILLFLKTIYDIMLSRFTPRFTPCFTSCFYSLYWALSLHWSYWQVLQGGNHLSKRRVLFSQVTYVFLLVSLGMSCAKYTKICDLPMFSVVMLISFVCYIANAVLVHQSFFRWHHYHLIILFPLLIHYKSIKEDVEWLSKQYLTK